jgi:hypothetical protein
MLQLPVSYSRRQNPRIETREGVSVYWSCGGRDDTSRVLNLSVSGLFIETGEQVVVGGKTKLDFLVQEGQIRAEAEVQHAKSGAGPGLKFTAVTPEDCTHLAALLTRLRQVGSIPQKPVIKELTVSENMWATQAPFASREA